ncbi:hypothetical protein EU537_00070 [Candidatus Thorarchaeota archaeon]|nr:MAG: hypothetical protein EU537_00070 [Candidatus Thorarchaeota archaeon]
MQSEPSEHESQKEKRTRYIVLLIILAAALFLPVLVIVYSSPYYGYVQVMAMTWIWYSQGRPFPVVFPFFIFMVISSLPFTFMRLVFVYMVNRYYLAKTTKKRVLMAGVAAELQAALIFNLPYILMFILAPGQSMYPMYAIPIPALIIIGYLIFRFRPPPVQKSWVEDSEKAGWWNEEVAKPAESEAPQQPVIASDETDESEDEEAREEETGEEQPSGEWLKETW